MVDPGAVLQNLRRHIAAGRARVHDLHSIDDLQDQLGSNYDDYFAELGSALTHQILSSERSLRLLIEAQGVPRFLDDFVAAMDGVGREPRVDIVGDDPDLPYNAALEEIEHWTDLLAPRAAAMSDHSQARTILRRMLKHLPQMVTLRETRPTREYEVQIIALAALQLAFPDAIREVSVTQPLKTYKPDIGIGSIDVAIELKFANDEAEAKKAVDELLADMKGFNGSKDYTSFFGVIYMTGPHISQQVLRAHIEKVGSPKPWDVFAVIGAGARVNPVKSGSGTTPAGPGKGKT